MTEAEWLTCRDPRPMLEFLRDKASDRKLRLFAVACWRTIWHLLTDNRSQKAVEVLERHADGDADTDLLDVGQAAHAAAEAGGTGDNPYAGWTAANAIGAGQVDEDDEASERTVNNALANAKDTAFSAAWAIGHHHHPDESGDAWHATTKAHEAAEAGLLREIVGNPFRPATISPAVLVWHDGLIVRLAQTAYEERLLPAGTLDNSRLAVLAEALEEAGCTSEDILGHLRGPGPHVRGCWATDLCLGKS